MKHTQAIVIVLLMSLLTGMLAACQPAPQAATDAPASSAPTAAAASAASSAPTLPPDDGPEFMNAAGMPIAKEPTTYSALVTLEAGETAWDELTVNQTIEEMTNVAFDYRYEPSTEFVQKLNLAFMSGTYDDIIFSRDAIKSIDDEAFGKDGFLIDLTPLIEEWMPNLQAMFEAHPEAKAASTAADGAIYGLPLFYQSVGGNPQVIYMDPYWLEATGRTEIVKTTDEMMSLLVDIKAVMDSGDYLNPNPEMYPLGYHAPTGDGAFTSLLLHGFTGTLCSVSSPWAAPDNQTMTFMAEHPGYRKTVEFMREVHRQELIDPEAYVMDGPTWQARINNCNYAIFGNSPTGQNPELVRGGGMAMHPLTSEFSDKYIINYEGTVVTNMLNITDQCENPEILARWADTFYADFDSWTETAYPNPGLAWLGPYGETWDFVDADGTPVADTTQRDYYQFRQQPEAPESIIDWTYLYTYHTGNWNAFPGWKEFPSIQLGSSLYEDKQRTTAAHMYPYCTTDTQMPPRARFTQAEIESIATKRTDLTSYLQRTFVEFITDQRSIEDEWDAFITECNRIGAAEITAVYQAVYDRWNAAL